MSRRSVPASVLGLVAAGLAALALSGCMGGGAGGGIGEEFNHGYLIDEQAVASVKPGMAPETVLQTLGTPSTVSTVGNKCWYYISQQSKRYVHFIGERRQDQRVTACTSTRASRWSAWRSTASRTARSSTSSRAPRRRAAASRPSSASSSAA